MANLDESTKKILLFLGLVLLIGIIVIVSLSLLSSSDLNLEEINDSIETGL